MRLFVASPLPADVRARYDEFVERLTARADHQLRAIPKHTAHITHAFLGEVRDVAPERLAEDVTRAVEGQRAIDITLGPPQVLRAGRVPRLVFAPIADGAEAITELSRSIVLALRAHPQFASLPFPKSSHVTLARFRKDAGTADAANIEALLAQRESQFITATTIQQVEIVRSVLGGPAPVYEVLTRIPLES